MESVFLFVFLSPLFHASSFTKLIIWHCANSGSRQDEVKKQKKNQKKKTKHLDNQQDRWLELTAPNSADLGGENPQSVSAEPSLRYVSACVKA